MLTKEEFEEFKKKSMEDDYILTPKEKSKMVKFIDHINEIVPKLRDRGIMQIVAFGPTCWNGGYNNKLKRGGRKKCWYCNYYHC